MRGAITKLVNPSKEAATTMAELGISATDSEGRLRPLDEIIEQLAPHADNTGAIMQIFGQRAGPAMAALVSQGADALREMTTALEQSGGTAQEIADTKLAGLTGAWTKLKSATEGVLIEIGSRLRPVLERLATLLTDRVLPAVRGALEAFDRLSPGMKTAAVVAVGLAAALGPALIALGGLVAVLTPLVPLFVALGKITSVTTALAALRTALVAVGLAAPAAAAGVVGVGAAATGTTAAVNTTTLSLARLRVALLTQLPTFTRWGRAITGAAATAGIAMSGLATGAGAKLAVAFGGLKAAGAGLGVVLAGTLAPAFAAVAAVAIAMFAAWKIGHTERVSNFFERLRLKLKGFTDEEIRTVQESRTLLEEMEKLRAAFDEFAEPLEALAAKDMAAWANATTEAKEKAQELAGALPEVYAEMGQLSQTVREFAAEAKLTPAVMREIARRALTLGLSVEDLTPELAALVTGFDASSMASQKAARSLWDLDGRLVGLQARGKDTPQMLQAIAAQARALADQGEELTTGLQEVVEAFQSTNAVLKAVEKTTSLDNLSAMALRLADTAQLPSDVMRVMAQRAQELQAKGGSLTKVLRNIVRAYGDSTAAGTGLSDSVQTLVDRLRGTGAIEAAHDWAAALDHVGGITTLTDGETGHLVTTLQTAIDKFQALGQAIPADLFEAYVAATRRLRQIPVEAIQIPGVAVGGQSHADRMQAFREWHELARREIARFVPVGIPLAPELPPQVGSMIVSGLRRAFRGFSPQISQTFTRALEGGGQWLGATQSLGVQAGTKLGEALSSGLATKMTTETSVFSKGIGQFFGKAMGQAIPFMGPVIGLGIGKIFGRFTKPSEAELAARQQIKDYGDTIIAGLSASQLAEAADAAQGHWAGNERGAQFLIGVRDAYVAVGKSAADAERDVTRLWQAEKRGPEAVAAVQREMQVVLNQAAELTARHQDLVQGLEGIRDAGHVAFDPAQLDPYLAQMQEAGLLTAAQAAEMRQLADDAHTDWQAMEEAARTYGVAMKTVVDEAGNETQVLDESLLGLGHAQAKLTDEAGRLAAAWQLLTGEGAHTGAAIAGMTDEAQGFVTKALEMGIALPAAMQPMIEKMIEQRRLTDEGGKKLTDLSELKFAQPIADKFDLLADKIQLLVIALGGPSGLSKAVEQMVDSAGLDIKGLAGEWAGMTAAMKAEFGSFAVFVEDRALREMVAVSGLNYDAIAAKWAAMTDAQQTAFGSFREFLRDHELTQLATDAGLTFDDLEQRWQAMTDAQRAETESFRAFVNRELDKIEDKTVTVRHRTEGSPSGVDNDDREHARHGTPFRQFGRGTPAMLHGLERVMTAGEGRGIQAALGRITGGLAAIADLSGVRALAEGGLVTRPTLALLGERGPEVVIPRHEIAEFGGGRRVEAKLDQLHQDFALLLDEFRHGLDPRRRARALVVAAALSTT